MLHIYYGDGKGKTTAAAGLALRMAGYGKKVLFVQFLKGGVSGEIAPLQKCGIKVMRCDREYGFFGEMTEEERADMTACHNANLKYALENADGFDIIVLDEIFSAYNYNLADRELVKRAVSECTCELVLTGHEPEEWFLERADYVSEIKKIKHPFDSGISARKGIEY